MRETRIFIEFIQHDNGKIDISTGGGSLNNGSMDTFDTVEDALSDLHKRIFYEANKFMNRIKLDNNPCLGCGCYNPDVGCTMPSHDKWYACPIYDNSKELAEILYSINKNMDFGDYSDTEKKSIENLASDISRAREFCLDNLISALGCICMGKVFKD